MKVFLLFFAAVLFSTSLAQTKYMIFFTDKGITTNERFEKTLKSGRKHVKQLIKSKKSIGEKTLFELYESRGIPPETVAQIASEQNVGIEVPMDFYTRMTGIYFIS